MSDTRFDISTFASIKSQQLNDYGTTEDESKEIAAWLKTRRKNQYAETSFFNKVTDAVHLLSNPKKERMTLPVVSRASSSEIERLRVAAENKQKTATKLR